MRGTEVLLMELLAQLRISVKDRNSIQQCESSHRSTALCEQKEMIHQQQEDCIPCLPLSRLPSVSINCYSLNSSQDQKRIVSSHKRVNLSVSFRHVRWFPRIFSKSRVFLSLILLFYRQSLAVSSSLRTPPSRLCVSRKKQADQAVSRTESVSVGAKWHAPRAPRYLCSFFSIDVPQKRQLNHIDVHRIVWTSRCCSLLSTYVTVWNIFKHIPINVNFHFYQFYQNY